MPLIAVLLAITGVAMMMFAAFATEPENIGRRAILGIAGLILLILGVYRL
jgi:hypothetical protein